MAHPHAPLLACRRTSNFRHSGTFSAHWAEYEIPITHSEYGELVLSRSTTNAMSHPPTLNTHWWVSHNSRINNLDLTPAVSVRKQYVGCDRERFFLLPTIALSIAPVATNETTQVSIHLNICSRFLLTDDPLKTQAMVNYYGPGQVRLSRTHSGATC